MSSWSLVLALSGYHYDAAKGHLAFAPVINEDDFRCFFSAGTAWGLFSQTRTAEGYTATLEVRWGEVTLRSLGLPLEGKGHLAVSLDSRPIEATLSAEGLVTFTTPATLRSGQDLRVGTDGE